MLNQPLTKEIKVSVIIPARNEAKFLASCINSIKSQDFSNYEIIVVDNGSTDDTPAIAENLGARVIQEKVPGLPRAREAGRKAARGELLVYLDADTIIPASYLSTIYRFFEAHKKVIAVSNPYFFYDGNWKTDTLIKFFFKILFPFYYKILKALNLPKVILGSNFVVRKETLEQIGGFNQALRFYGEDVDISKRLSKQGEVVFINRWQTLTSARRFKQQGIFRTCFMYFANYFSVCFFNRPLASFTFKIVPMFKYVTTFLILFGLLLYGFASPKSEIFGRVIYNLNCRDKKVALTFDDGPNGKYTEQILDILDKNGVKGTFFLIGKNVEMYPAIAREIVKRGNYLGNHSYSHNVLLPFKSEKALINDINKAEEVIYNATGVHTRLFRPPHGFRTPWMIMAIHKMGYKIITWDDMTTDYDKRSKGKDIARSIISQVKPGSIIVLHDGLNLNHGVSRENTIEALKIILKQLKAENYKFVTLKELE
ncbi:MAG: polysaccharide deacetylase family protein [candidate division WOR-3 bacterium]